MAIKTQYIIAPYQSDPNTWTMRVAWLHNRLVAHMDAMPCIIVSQHANILAGCYGDDNDEAQRQQGLRSTLLHVGYVAMGYGNELFVITNDDGTASDGMASQALRVWKETRDDFDHDEYLCRHMATLVEEFEADYNPVPTPDTKPDTDDDSEDYTDI